MFAFASDSNSRARPAYRWRATFGYAVWRMTIYWRVGVKFRFHLRSYFIHKIRYDVPHWHLALCWRTHCSFIHSFMRRRLTWVSKWVVVYTVHRLHLMTYNIEHFSHSLTSVAWEDSKALHLALLTLFIPCKWHEWHRRRTRTCAQPYSPINCTMARRWHKHRTFEV